MRGLSSVSRKMGKGAESHAWLECAMRSDPNDGANWLSKGNLLWRFDRDIRGINAERIRILAAGPGNILRRQMHDEVVALELGM